MRVAIVGSRSFANEWGKDTITLVERAVCLSGWYHRIKTIISGGAVGIDKAAERYAEQQKIKLVRFTPNWHKYGKAAGFIRNKEMVFNSDAVIAVWDGKSKGTSNTIQTAEIAKRKVFILKVESLKGG